MEIGKGRTRRVIATTANANIPVSIDVKILPPTDYHLPCTYYEVIKSKFSPHCLSAP